MFTRLFIAAVLMAKASDTAGKGAGPAADAAVNKTQSQVEQGKTDEAAKATQATADAGAEKGSTTAAANLKEFEQIGRREEQARATTTDAGDRRPRGNTDEEKRLLAARAASVAAGGIDIGQGLSDFLEKLAQTNPSAVEPVNALVPKTYRLTVDNGVCTVIEAGVRRLPRYIVEHQWSKAHGVKAYDQLAENIGQFLDELPNDVAAGKYDDPDYPLRMMARRFGEANITPAMVDRVRQLFPIDSK